MRAAKSYHYNKWNDEDLRTLRRMLEEGRHTAEIAAELGRTYQAVANVIYRIRKGERYGKRL